MCLTSLVIEVITFEILKHYFSSHIKISLQKKFIDSTVTVKNSMALGPKKMP